MADNGSPRELERIAIFSALEPDALRLLSFSAETRILRMGDALFRQGETSDGGYVLIEGLLGIEGGGASQSEVFRPGVLIGEAALLTSTQRPMSLVARSPATVLKISRQLFHRVLREYPKSAVKVQALLQSRLSSFTAEMEVSRLRDFSGPELAHETSP